MWQTKWTGLLSSAGWTQSECDSQFHWNMLQQCREEYPSGSNWFYRGFCYDIASLYKAGVVMFGFLSYDNGQDRRKKYGHDISNVFRLFLSVSHKNE